VGPAGAQGRAATLIGAISDLVHETLAQGQDGLLHDDAPLGILVRARVKVDSEQVAKTQTGLS